mmetsp:Transcript_17653/g.29012  ORF Transcript_17653/g.29012 Transcript_17653/m.29012 type:complete len:146 (-) Transcript_17653:3508-3945(-)|eukprot:CAMPEP_0184344366 /NCGR_PEP_ID=MMETSP1089-20130417/12880_1 /TAXON_ID=38269 ORGANISM="Gloeochaete wittrockiana, Strain SAG46.84" /NCGR_SAMPLE_ID=MMETSP1089 /ASSEMBLY_ACC=CAM_ASM_000445 /LENGTH=145 /DNA_ID=CAMNT_0026674177 /DNA_START=52 /DNA_END=489 /DNA_ORIENTATION=-
MKQRKLYFCGSIRGGRGDIDYYAKIISHCKKHGRVLTEHIGDKALSSETSMTDEQINARDMVWIEECDLVIAEVTTPSLGVGIEIARAEDRKKPILCLFRTTAGQRLSALVSGNPNFNSTNYTTVEEAQEIIDRFIEDQDLKERD